MTLLLLAGLQPDKDSRVKTRPTTMSRILAIATKEIRQLRRDRLTFGMIVGIPLLQMLLFGYAINFDVRGLSAGVVDEARTSMSRALVAMPLQERAGVYRANRPVFEVRTEYNPEKRTAVQIVPALIGVILTMTMTMFTAVAIVRERERGNLELLITTPASPLELMLGKLVPYVFIGLIQTTLVLLLGVLLFNVPINGSLWAFYFAALLFIAATLTLGLIASTLAETQMQAFQMSIFVLLPSILLSGFVFPFDGMPQVARWIAQLLPLTHFVELVRGIVLRGAGLAELLVPIYKLLAFTAVALTVVTLRFHKRLD
jgi:ABC-2 type transport system permease protein